MRAPENPPHETEPAADGLPDKQAKNALARPMRLPAPRAIHARYRRNLTVHINNSGNLLGFMRVKRVRLAHRGRFTL